MHQKNLMKTFTIKIPDLWHISQTTLKMDCLQHRKLIATMKFECACLAQ